jgi:hypothetical protein
MLICWGRIKQTIKENIEALVVASKEIGLQVNVDKTKHMVMSRDQNARQRYNIKLDNSSFERVEEFKYLGTTLCTTMLFRKRLRADCSWGMLAIIQCKIFCLPICCPKI